jgi:hypothetical protein
MSDRVGYWNDREQQALHELPLAARVIYLQELRWNADADGMVGLKRRISLRGLTETLTVPAASGRHKSAQASPTRDAVRHVMRLLLDAGLIVRVRGFENTLVYRLPLAVAPQSVPRRSTTGAPQEHHTSSTTPNASDTNASDDTSTTGAPHRTEPRSTTHHQSPITALGKSSVNPEVEVIGGRAREIDAIQAADAIPPLFPTEAGRACVALRAVGVYDAIPSDMKLQEALNSGITTAQLVATAAQAILDGKPRMAYVVATAMGKTRDAKVASSKQASLEANNRAVAGAWAAQDVELEEVYAPQ